LPPSRGPVDARSCWSHPITTGAAIPGSGQRDASSWVASSRTRRRVSGTLAPSARRSSSGRVPPTTRATVEASRRSDLRRSGAVRCEALLWYGAIFGVDMAPTSLAPGPVVAIRASTRCARPDVLLAV